MTIPLHEKDNQMMHFKAAKYVFVSLGVLALSGSPCVAQNTIFVQFSGLNCQGAADPNFPGSAISSVSLEGDNPVSFNTTGGGSGKVSFTDIKLVKTLDDCTPLLFQNLAMGTQFQAVTIKIVSPATASTPATPLVIIQLSGASLSSDQLVQAAGGRPSELVTVAFVKITLTHVPSNKTFSWNIQTNSSN